MKGKSHKMSSIEIKYKKNFVKKYWKGVFKSEIFGSLSFNRSR